MLYLQHLEGVHSSTPPVMVPKTTQRTPIQLYNTHFLRPIPYHSAHQEARKSFGKTSTSWHLPSTSIFFLVRLFKQVTHAAQWGDGKCCSHQWELYGLLKWAHSASERSAACVFSPSLNRKRHPRPLTHSLSSQHPKLVQTTRGKLILLVIHPHVD